MFVPIRPEETEENVFSLIGQDWMLLTASKDDGSFNSMTASWGGLGILWGKPVCFCYIRPQRYTHEFSEAGTRMTACFFAPEYRKALAFCGKESGRHVDKAKACGLTPVRHTGGYVYYNEARLVLCLRKLYTDRIRPEGFADPALLSHYAAADFHTVYVYEIEQILRAEDEA